MINRYYYTINNQKNTMDNFSSQILSIIKKKKLVFPGMSQEAILNQIVPIAEEWVLMQIVTDHLWIDDQMLFRDCYRSWPDVFDSSEFLLDILPDLDLLIEQYFEIWLNDFQKQLHNS